VTWQRHPVWFVVLMLAVPFWREFHFYWIHRAIHWKPMYKHVHSLHHKNVNPGPWSGMAMHPLETAIYLSSATIHWIIPSHPLHFLFNLQNTALSPACSHHGFEGPILEGKMADRLTLSLPPPPPLRVQLRWGNPALGQMVRHLSRRPAARRRLGPSGRATVRFPLVSETKAGKDPPPSSTGAAGRHE
jgi:hypothetical protein